jgi:hypothetical protein
MDDYGGGGGGSGGGGDDDDDDDDGRGGGADIDSVFLFTLYCLRFSTRQEKPAFKICLIQ